MRKILILLTLFNFLLVNLSCKTNDQQQDQSNIKKIKPDENSGNPPDQELRNCLGPKYPEAVLFKTEYLKLINPQTADYEIKNSSNIYEMQIDLDKDGFNETAVTGLLSLKPEVESEGKYKGFIAIFKKTADQCKTLFFKDMDTGEISNMNLIFKENKLMVALAANTGYSILIEYQNGKYQIVEENDEGDDDNLPEELKSHHLN